MIQGQHEYRLAVSGLVAVLLMAVVSAIAVGRYPIPIGRVLLILTSQDRSLEAADTDAVVVRSVRVPRVAAACAAGAGLALGGAALQGLFRNPLVGPQVVGMSSGAAFGGVVAMFAGLSSSGVVGSAFAAGMLSIAAVFGLNRLARGGRLGIVLAGVIVSSFFTAGVGAVQFMADPERQLPGMVYWLLGSFASIGADASLVVVIPTFIGAVALWLLRWRLNFLSLDDDDARALGVQVEMLRWSVLAIITLMVAAQVAVSGAIGWVGLVVPHIARALVGPDQRRLLVVSGLLGGTYLLLMDTIARSVSAQEIPIGVLTALVGTPVFAALFWRTQSSGWSRG